MSKHSARVTRVPRTQSFSTYRPSSTRASELMRRNRREGGAAERLLRSHLWRSGARFRLHAPDLPGRPDVVFRSARVCVFCDGDFWHGRRWDIRKEKLRNGSNAPYWVDKIARNRARDRMQTRALRREGWTVIRVWETDVLRAPELASAAILRALARAKAEKP